MDSKLRKLLGNVSSYLENEDRFDSDQVQSGLITICDLIFQYLSDVSIRDMGRYLYEVCDVRGICLSESSSVFDDDWCSLPIIIDDDDFDEWN